MMGLRVASFKAALLCLVLAVQQRGASFSPFVVSRCDQFGGGTTQDDAAFVSSSNRFRRRRAWSAVFGEDVSSRGSGMRAVRHNRLTKRHTPPQSLLRERSYLSSVGTHLFARRSSDNEEEEDIDLSDKDWREFRAKLVMQKGSKSAEISASEAVAGNGDFFEDDLDGIGTIFGATASSPPSPTEDVQTADGAYDMSKFTPLDPSQWAYDSGKVIEQGAVILGGVEQDFGFGLRQQYFHKAAILVLGHDASFTKGIILNRPSDRLLEDDVNPGVKWRIWFGGDVQGIESGMADITCLHSLKSEQAVEASFPVMKDIQWTTFENAKKLVNLGAAKTEDFWVFAGYAGWGPQQLMGELERKSWYMVATDSQTLLKELARQSAGADPRDAGLDTWDLLMNMIGRGETAEDYSGTFDDLMLKEWARDRLLSIEAGGGGGVREMPADVASTQELQSMSPVDMLMIRANAASRGQDVTEGTVLRGSSAERSPFLLSRQEYHKSVVLIVMDDADVSVGVLLNHPSSKGIDMEIVDKTTRSKKVVTIPLRYGGEYSVKGQASLLWLHCSHRLRANNIGSPIGTVVLDDKDGAGIWKCSESDVTSAISQGLAKPDDFMAVSGVSVWTKGEGGISRGMQGEVYKEKFEVVRPSKVEDVWGTLIRQEVLSNASLLKNMALVHEAWMSAEIEGDNIRESDEPSQKRKVTSAPIGGLGEGYDEEDDSLVFKSDTKVAHLSDSALRSWVATFLLGAPRLGG